ncbi:MAG: hypothetical protein M3P98_01545 [bacterium]|nr:hypothetical protein [bacterium]
MAEIIYTHSLTTVARVKNRLVITDSGFDTVFLRGINAMTDLIESYCNRRFKSTMYTDQIISTRHGGTDLLLKQSPVTSLASISYTVGMPKTWTAYNATNDYELIEDGKSGIVKMYAGLPKGENTIKVTYTAGYLIDWANFGSSTHTLPADLSDLCERLVVRIFKRRDAEGKSQEGFESNAITWATELTKEDKMTLAKYKRFAPFE